MSSVSMAALSLTPPLEPHLRLPSPYREKARYCEKPRLSPPFPALHQHHPRRLLTPSDEGLFDMATTHAHRGLPPPSAITLPDPTRPRRPSLSESHAPPFSARAQWPREDDGGREWYHIQVEEEKRRQEGERTHQEKLRLDQRRIEHDMLRDAIGAGVPPHLIPMIFAGLSGGPVAQANFEMAQQYLSQLSQRQTPPGHSIHASPEKHDAAHAAYSNSGAPGQPFRNPPFSASHSHSTVYPSPAYQSPETSRDHSLYAPHLASKGSTSLPALPRLTTNEATAGPQANYSHHHTSQASQQGADSPNIYFHHWQPPGKDSGAGASTKDNSEKPSPNPSSLSTNRSQPASGDLSRKRKATGPHQAPPVPSPSFSVGSTGSATDRKPAHRSRTSAGSARSVERADRRDSREGSAQPHDARARDEGEHAPEEQHSLPETPSTKQQSDESPEKRDATT